MHIPAYIKQAVVELATDQPSILSDDTNFRKAQLHAAFGIGDSCLALEFIEKAITDYKEWVLPDNVINSALHRLLKNRQHNDINNITLGDNEMLDEEFWTPKKSSDQN